MMTAIAPPPVGNEAEPSVQLDNARALDALQAGDRNRERGRAGGASMSMRARRASIGALLGFGAATLVAGAAFGAVTGGRRNKAWYRLLQKPSFTPPDRVFRLVWPALYATSATAGWRVWRSPPSRARSVALASWAAQLAFNAAWTPLFFGAHRPRLALADLIGNFVSLGAFAYASSQIDRPAAVLSVPYLGWVGFAGAMNAGIIAKNAGRFAGWCARG